MPLVTLSCHSVYNWINYQEPPTIGPNNAFCRFVQQHWGFHHALSKLGHECVFACDIDEECRKVYHENWDMTAFDDVRTWSKKSMITKSYAWFSMSTIQQIGKSIGV